MAEEQSHGRVPVLVGVVVGVIVGAAGAGVPLFMKARDLEAQVTSLTRERDTAQLALANAQTDLTSVQTDLTSAKQQLQQQQAVAASTQEQLQQQQAVTAELSKPTLPLQLSVRRGILDAGLVLTIRNVSAQEVAVMAKIQSVGGEGGQKRIVIPPNVAREIGESEGWAFTARDTVTLSSPGYQDMIYMVPMT